MTKIISVNDLNEFNSKVADIIKESIERLLLKQEIVVFAVPGGRSVAGIFNKLKEKDISWNKVHIFMVDERIVPIDDPKSNFKIAKEHFIGELLDKGLLPEKNVHPFIIGEDLEVESYAEELKKHGGKYDVVLLSSGEDSHVAALYPNHHSIKDDSIFFFIMHDSPKPPKGRMSMSRKLLAKSKVAILLFLGEIKKEAYRKFQDDNIDVNSCPAKIVLSIKDSYVLTNLNN